MRVVVVAVVAVVGACVVVVAAVDVVVASVVVVAAVDVVGASVVVVAAAVDVVGASVVVVAAVDVVGTSVVVVAAVDVVGASVVVVAAVEVVGSGVVVVAATVDVVGVFVVVVAATVDAVAASVVVVATVDVVVPSVVVVDAVVLVSHGVHDPPQSTPSSSPFRTPSPHDRFSMQPYNDTDVVAALVVVVVRVESVTGNDTTISTSALSPDVPKRRRRPRRSRVDEISAKTWLLSMAKPSANAYAFWRSDLTPATLSSSLVIPANVRTATTTASASWWANGTWP
jgi:hypothetical protein